MTKLRKISFVFLISLFLQCSLVVPDVTGYIAALVGLIPKSKQSTTLEYEIRVSVSGLVGTGLVLQNNGSDNLTIPANGGYAFLQKIASNSTYAVTILTQPTNPSQTCVVTGGSGTVISGDVTSIVVNCSTTTYTLGGTVTGLLGTGLILQNAGGETQIITSNGNFAFATPFADGRSYSISIQTQPSNPAQVCTVTNGTGVIASANVSSISVSCNTNTYTVGGTVNGLLGTGLVLQNNNGDNLTLSANGSFTFATAINSGASYSVSILSQPVNPVQSCIVTGGTGTIVGGNVTSVSINCTTNSFTLGGTVTGLFGAGMILQNNGGDNLTISANGSFAFSTPINSGSAYNVTISTQPGGVPSQTCMITNNVGTVSNANITNITVNCTINSYVVGGTVSGFSGSGLILQNNSTNNLVISGNGAFVFSVPINSGAGYSVSILAQPTSPSQTCIVTGGTGSIVSGNITSVSVNCTTNTYTIGGTVTGLSGTGLVLQNNAGNNLTISANGSFAFSTPINSGTGYAVTVSTQPTTPAQTCSVTSGTGSVVGANITNVAVSCTTNTYTIGGTVTGLTGTGLVLQNNNGDNLSVSASGTFTFATAINSGLGYSITVLTQPSSPIQTCIVTGGTGTIVGGNITSVSVNCTTNTYTIGGTVTGLSGTGLVLQNNGGNNLTISANGSFAFSTPINSGAGYTATVLTQPSSPTQTCSITSGTGTVVGTNITNVAVNCTTNSYTVGGTVSGLSGMNVVLQNNGGDNLVVSANGSFTFATAINSGVGYTATVFTQPSSPSQTCTITTGTGTVSNANITNISINCITDSFTVGGTVSGLSGSGLILQNNGGDNLSISADGSFTFATAVNSGLGFSVTVQTQPTSPTQTCNIAGGTGTIVGGNITSVNINCATNNYSVGGTVSGLSGTGLVLQNNGGDSLSVSANGGFAFATVISSGASYNVTILTQPSTPTQTCTVTSESGTVAGANITSVAVNCTTNAYTIGGTVTGLSGTGLVLQNNSGDNLSVSADGTFTFATAIDSGLGYSVTVFTQPTSPSQTCSVTTGTGTVANANITTVAVNCITNTYTIGGTVASLVGTGMVLQNNSGDNLTISASGTFSFTTPINSGDAYNITILTQPTSPSQTCAVSSGAGTVATANITSVSITCGAASYTVGGTISGLTGTGLILEDSVTNQTLPITANGSFTFSVTYANGATYNAFIQTHASSQFCVVTSGGSGTIASANVTNMVLTCYSSGQNISNQINGIAGSNTEILRNCMQYDSATNSIYMAGVIIGGGALDGEANPSGAGFNSAFISKYDTNGNRQWTRIESAGAGRTVNAMGLALDASGNAYITGTVFGTGASLNGNTVVNQNASFVIKYNSSGTRLWTSGRFGQRNEGRYIGIDSAGNVYVTGTMQSDFLDGQANTGWTDDGLTLVKYDSNGTWLASRVLGATTGLQGNMYGYGIAFDSANNIFIAVASTATSRCGPGPDRNWNGPALIRYNSGMTYLGCTGGYTGISGVHSEPFSIVKDTSDNFYITGYTRGSIDGTPLAGAASNMFVSKFNSSGTKIWTRAMGVAGVDTIATSIARSPENFLYVSGYTGGNLDGQTKTGNSDLFVTKYDLNGTKIWTTLVGGAGATAGMWGGGILVDNFNTVYAGGYTNGNAGAVVNPYAPNSAFLISRFYR